MDTHALGPKQKTPITHHKGGSAIVLLMGDAFFDRERGGRQSDGGGRPPAAQPDGGCALRRLPRWHTNCLASATPVAAVLRRVRSESSLAPPHRWARGLLVAPRRRYPTASRRGCARSSRPRHSRSQPIPLWGPDIHPRHISFVIRHACKDGGRGTARVATPCPRRPPLPRRHRVGQPFAQPPAGCTPASQSAPAPLLSPPEHASSLDVGPSAPGGACPPPQPPTVVVGSLRRERCCVA